MNSPLTATAETPVFSTMLELVSRLSDEIDDEGAVVELAAELVNSGRAILTGNFRGCRIELEAA